MGWCYEASIIEMNHRDETKDSMEISIDRSEESEALRQAERELPLRSPNLNSSNDSSTNMRQESSLDTRESLAEVSDPVRNRRTSKMPWLVLMGGTCLALFASLAVLTLINLQNDRVNHDLLLQLAKLDHEFLKARTETQHLRTVHSIYTCTNGSLVLEYNEPTRTPRDNLEKYENHKKNAKKRFPSLRQTNSEFREYKERYLRVVARQERTSTKILAVGLYEVDWPGLYSMADHNAAQNGRGTAPGSENSSSGNMIDAYEEALVQYRQAIDNVRTRTQSVLRTLSWSSLCVVLIMYFFLSRAWCQVLGQKQHSDIMRKEREHQCQAKDRVIGAKVGEIEIQKKCLNQFSHELRNKYTPAISMLESIKEIAESPTAPPDMVDMDSLNTSIGLLHEASQLISTRLEMHKIYKGHYVSEANVDTVDVDVLLQSRVDAASALGKPGVTFKFDKPNGLKNFDVSVSVDLFIFFHIANNLLSNARKHTNHGEIVLSFVEETENGALCFSVRDTGKGMEESIANRLFKEEVTTGDARGIGLGLVSCKAFAEAVGGSTWLEWTKPCTLDDVNAGTEFRFVLPGRIVNVQQRDDSTTAAWLETTARSLSEPSPENKDTIADYSFYLSQVNHILVVEDSDIIRKCIIAKLTQVCKQFPRGSPVTFESYETVEGVIPTLGSFAKREDVIITVDESLESKGGVMTGTDLIKKLHTIGAKCLIISCTGDVETATEHKALGALVLGKPLPNAKKVIHAIEKFKRKKLSNTIEAMS